MEIGNCFEILVYRILKFLDGGDVLVGLEVEVLNLLVFFLEESGFEIFEFSVESVDGTVSHGVFRVR